MINKVRLLLTWSCYLAASCIGCGSQPLPVPNESVLSPEPAQQSARQSAHPTQVSPAIAIDDIGGLISGSSTRDDPADDLLAQGWQTEVLSAAAGSLLADALSGLTTTAMPTEAGVSQHLSDSFACATLRPVALDKVFSDGTTTVLRLADASEVVGGPTATGPAGLCAALSDLRSVYAGSEQVRKKVKIVRVAVDGKQAQTRALLELVAQSAEQTIQINVTLDCDWQVDQLPSPNRPPPSLAAPSLASPLLASPLLASPLLASLSVADYEQIVSHHAQSAQFQEATASVFEPSPAYGQEFMLSSDVWAQRVETQLGADFMGYHGIAVADVNGDGLDDLYVCQAGGLPNRLFMQQADGTATDVSEASGLDLLDSSRSALLLDLDNDADQDAVVATAAGVMFFENVGESRFEFRHQVPNSRQAYSLAAADYDQDGDVDVYACLYHAPTDAAAGNPLPYHDAQNGSPNVLISNRGDWQWADGTSQAGLDVNNNRWSYAASWEDYDNDGDPDLYVANDFGRNNLYQNNQGQFRDVAATAGVEDIASGMSVVWGDYDRNGTMDLYVSNMYSSAGGRVTFQRNFNPSATSATRSNLQRLARGNSLFLNQGDGSFRDVSLDAGVNMARWAWGASFADVNNDGYEDLYVANGNYTGEDTDDL